MASSGQRGFTSKRIGGVGLLLPRLQAHGGGHGNHGAVVGAQGAVRVVHAHAGFAAAVLSCSRSSQLAPAARHHHALQARLLPGPPGFSSPALPQSRPRCLRQVGLAGFQLVAQLLWPG